MQTIRSLILPLVIWFSFLGSPSSARDLKGSVAQVDITAPVGYRMAGYFDERLATGIHDPLFAKAIVLQDGKETITMVFCDLVGVPLDVSRNARVQASAKTGIPFSHILISATHSHTGPLFNDVRSKYLHQMAVEKYGNDPHQQIDYPKFLTDRLAEVIVKAHSQLRPVSVALGIGRQYNLAFNRRFHMKNGSVAFNPGQLNPNIIKPAGPSDPDVGILLIGDKKRKRILGGLTVFAMHADTLGGTEYSADYPFFLSETLKKSFGTNFISAFAPGTCGDVNHINVSVKEPVKGVAVAEKLGTTLGRTVLEAASRLDVLKKPSFTVKSGKIIAPLQEISPERLASAKEKISKLGDSATAFFTKVEAVKALDIAEKGSSWPMEVQVFRLDKETAIVGLPCEIFVELGLAIKRESPFKKTIVMSICNDRPSYVPTKKAFFEGSYEVSNARVKPGVGEMLVEKAVELLKEAAVGR